ncbi:hypothetical protein GQX73_g719 [Xylaria multiplex]|uniref:Uncharacterized protein n=1 Tax=Xylaria multiplex TaxID=323545 RepID=A0A7C8IUP9_9PEZI|nr:hypothetical protein GQX73_g719 [Xylaria multiplex]
MIAQESRKSDRSRVGCEGISLGTRDWRLEARTMHRPLPKEVPAIEYLWAHICIYYKYLVLHTWKSSSPTEQHCYQNASYTIMMPPQSVPVILSPFSHNGIDAQTVSRGRSRLSLHPPRSLVAGASPSGSLSPLHGQHQQPYPFPPQGPVTIEYTPLRPARYYRRPDLQPIVPLRDEFSIVSNIRGGHGSMTLQGLGQPRPHSVAPHYPRTSQTRVDHYTQEIPRPASVVHTGTQELIAFNYTNLKSLSDGIVDKKKLSLPEQSVLENSAYENDFMPPKRELPFPSRNQAKAQTTNSKLQLETMVKKSPLKVALTAIQEVDQFTTKKAVPSHNLAEGVEAPASQPLPSNKRVNNKRGIPHKRLNDAAAVNLDAAKRIKSNVINEYASQQKHSKFTSTSAATYMDKGASSRETSQGEIISRDLNPGADGVGASVTYVEPSQARDLSYTHPVDTQETLVACSSTPKFLHSTMIDPPLSSHDDRSSKSRASQPKRSFSQATTESTASTTLLHTTGNEDTQIAKDPPNQMLMIDETMILEQDISDIVNIRLQQGRADMLDTLYGELLIKMAVKDEKRFDAVSRILQS